MIVYFLSYRHAADNAAMVIYIYICMYVSMYVYIYIYGVGGSG